MPSDLDLQLVFCYRSTKRAAATTAGLMPPSFLDSARKEYLRKCRRNDWRNGAPQTRRLLAKPVDSDVKRAPASSVNANTRRRRSWRSSRSSLQLLPNDSGHYWRFKKFQILKLLWISLQAESGKGIHEVYLKLVLVSFEYNRSKFKRTLRIFNICVWTDVHLSFLA